MSDYKLLNITRVWTGFNGFRMASLTSSCWFEKGWFVTTGLLTALTATTVLLEARLSC
jgi:hypothetical protein